MPSSGVVPEAGRHSCVQLRGSCIQSLPYATLYEGILDNYLVVTFIITIGISY